MGFTKTDNASRNLRESDLVSEKKLDKICYVLNYRSGNTVNNSGFYTLYVKTEDQIVVPARIFNLKDFIESGLDIASLKSKFIRIVGTSQHFGGYSIIVDSIYSVEQDRIENRENFLGKIQNVEELFDECVQFFGTERVFPTIYKVTSYPSLYGGKVGGYVKFVSNWMYQVAVYADMVEEDLSEILMECILYYSKYLNRINEIDFITMKDKVDILRVIHHENPHISALVLDTMQAILGLGSPEHLVAHIIHKAFDITYNMSYIGEKWKNLPKGGDLKLEGKEILRKY